MANPHRHQFLQASDNAEALTGVSHPFEPTDSREDFNFRMAIVIYAATAMTGNIQGGIYNESRADMQWGNIQGGDLSESDFTDGGATQLMCRYDGIRINVTGGTGKVRIIF